MEGDLQRVFGNNVRALRQSLDLSQEAFAHRLDRNRTYIGAIERGERNLRLRTVERLSDVMKAEPLQMLSSNETDRVPPLAPKRVRRSRKRAGEQ